MPARPSLRGYQKDIISWIHKRESSIDEHIPVSPGWGIRTNLSIVNSPPGSGKTRIICGALKTSPSSFDEGDSVVTDTFNVNSTELIRIGKRKLVDLTIIIISPSLVKQWETELDAWNIKYKAYIKPSDGAKPNGLKVILTTPLRVRTLMDTLALDVKGEGHPYDHLFQSIIGNGLMSKTARRMPPVRVTFKRLIIDEPDTITIPSFNVLPEQFRSVIAVSATLRHTIPKFLIEYRMVISMLTTLFNHPRVIKLITSTHSEDNHVPQQEEALSDFNTTTILYYMAPIITAVAAVLTPHMAELITKGAYDEILAAIGGNIVNGDIVSYAVKRIETTIKNLEGQIDIAQNAPGLKAQLEEAKEKKKLLLERIEENVDCPICSELLDDARVYCASCYMCYHQKCLTDWFSQGFGTKTCPNCRGSLSDGGMTIQKIARGGPAEPEEVPDESPNSWGIYPSIDGALSGTLEHIIATTDSPKIIIASNFGSGVYRCAEICASVGLQSKFLTGAATTRQRAVDAFKAGKIPVFIMDTRMNSAGLHLPETTHVIIMPGVVGSEKTQIIGRAQRVGRIETLEVYEITPSDVPPAPVVSDSYGGTPDPLDPINGLDPTLIYE